MDETERIFWMLVKRARRFLGLPPAQAVELVLKLLAWLAAREGKNE